MLVLRNILDVPWHEIQKITARKSFAELYEQLMAIAIENSSDPRLLKSGVLYLIMAMSKYSWKCSSILKIFDISVYEDYINKLINDQDFYTQELAMVPGYIKTLSYNTSWRKKHEQPTVSVGIIDESKIKDGDEVTILCGDSTKVNIPGRAWSTNRCY